MQELQRFGRQVWVGRLGGRATFVNHPHGGGCGGRRGGDALAAWAHCEGRRRQRLAAVRRQHRGWSNFLRPELLHLPLKPPVLLR